MLEVGFVAETPDVLDNLISSGYMGIHEAEFLTMLDYFCDPALSLAGVTPFRSQVITGLVTPSQLRRKGFADTHWMSRPLYRHLHQMDLDTLLTDEDESGANSAIDYKALLPAAASLAKATQLVEEGLLRNLSAALFIPEMDIDPSKPPSAAGIDSLVAVELKYWLLKEIRAEVAVFNILGNMSITSLCEFALSKSPSWKS